MDFLFSEEQNAFRLRARAWLAEHLPAAWRGGQHHPELDDDADAVFQQRWEQSLHAGGFAGLHWPKAVGGQGLSLWEHLIFQEELGRVAAPEGINSIGRELVGPLLLHLGTPQQQARYLPRILDTTEIWCQGFSEPGAGSDLRGLRTRATRTEEGWILQGQKVWTSFARYAQFCIVLARTAGADAGRDSLTLFIVPMSAAGVRVRPLEQITGRAEFNEVFFDGVLVPEDAVIGGVNAGWPAARTVLDIERGTNRLYRQARFMNEWHEMARLARRLEVDVDAELGDLAAGLMVLRSRSWRLVRRVVEGDPVGAETSVHKLHWSTLHARMCQLGLRLVGEAMRSGDGDAPGVQRLKNVYSYARAETIFAGTTQIQQEIVADRVLALPRK